MNRARLSLPLLTVAAALALGGCKTMPQASGGAPVKLEDLIRQIKSDIGQYNAYAAAHAADAPLNTACGGKVDLTIKAVTVTVTTVSKVSQDGSLGAEVAPVAVLKLSGGVARGAADESTQTLNFTLEPVTNATAAAAPETGPPSRLYAVLRDLRESLLRASNATPCLRFPQKDQDNSVEFAFQATRTTTTSFGVNLYIFAAGGSRSRETVAANTIKINFEGGGSSFLEVVP